MIWTSTLCTPAFLDCCTAAVTVELNTKKANLLCSTQPHVLQFLYPINVNTAVSSTVIYLFDFFWHELCYSLGQIPTICTDGNVYWLKIHTSYCLFFPRLCCYNCEVLGYTWQLWSINIFTFIITVKMTFFLSGNFTLDCYKRQLLKKKISKCCLLFYNFWHCISRIVCLKNVQYQ